MMQRTLTPLLVVRDAARAVEFYVEALGATEVARFKNARTEKVSHVELALASARFALTEEARAWNSDAPPSLGGSPVVLVLEVDDADRSFDAMCSAGATVVFPLQEFAGERMGRLRDPFGHLWIVTQRIEHLSIEEIQKRRDELATRFGSAGRRASGPPEEEPKVDPSDGSTQAPDTP